MLSIKGNGFADFLSDLTALERDQIPYATQEALNATATVVKSRLEDEIRSVFDRPTPYTVNSLRILYASKKKGIFEARVWMKDEADGAAPASRWLTPEVYGGPRPDKRTESLLKARGILPEGKFVVPGKGVKLDSYGNIGRGQLQRILSGLGAQFDRASNSTDSKRSLKKGNRTRYFLMKRGTEAIGIAERTGKQRDAVQLVIAFVGKPGYGKTLDFFGVGEREADAQLPAQFEKAFERALATRRR